MECQGAETSDTRDFPTFEGALKLGLSEEDRREVGAKVFPELEHISDSSSPEERRIAFGKLHKRLGIPLLPDKLFQ